MTADIYLRPVGGRDLRRLGERLVVRRAGEAGDGIRSGWSAAQLAVAGVVDTAAGDLDVAPTPELHASAVMENCVETGETRACGEEYCEQEDGADGSTGEHGGI